MHQLQPGLGVIFDMDGVLVDSADLHFEAWKRLGEDIKVPFPHDVFEQTFGMHNREIIPLWLSHRALTAERIELLAEQKEVMYREVAKGFLRPIDGAVNLVTSLADAGFVLALGSSGPRANVELVLDLLGVRSRFAALVTGDEVRHGKPHPEVFMKAAEMLDLPPIRCLVIEDAPQGVQAGLDAGAHVAAVCTSRQASELKDAHLVIESLNELNPTIVRRILEHHIQHSPVK
ncbi:MAG TPA: HAD family phosphatase [Planctomycetota bacterium]|nr:HAD family phosphatase [Planctomycetota bacterium]